jgi:hypothetical protein
MTSSSMASRFVRDVAHARLMRGGSPLKDDGRCSPPCPSYRYVRSSVPCSLGKEAPCSAASALPATELRSEDEVQGLEDDRRATEVQHEEPARAVEMRFRPLDDGGKTVL